MIIEAMLETVFPIIGRALSFIFIQILINTVFYITGFIISTLVTFGKYPKKFMSIGDASLDKVEGWVVVVGGIFWLALLLLIFV